MPQRYQPSERSPSDPNIEQGFSMYQKGDKFSGPTWVKVGGYSEMPKDKPASMKLPKPPEELLNKHYAK
jgi:hypothetical protein